MSAYCTVSFMILAFLLSHPACAGSSDVPGQSPPGKAQSRQGSGLPGLSGKLFGASSQALLVRNRNLDSPGSFAVQVIAREKRAGRWENAFAPMDGVIGKNGFAPPGEKREGDGRTPSGIFPLGTVFGYAPSFPTKMPYRQAGPDDLWVDDVRADDYNRWVTRTTTRAASFEKMRRDDDLYKLGVVVEYNTHPVIKGQGSAIFFHLWRGKGSATEGCIALPEEDLMKIVRWLNPAAAPVAMMGTNITREDRKQ